MKSRISIKGQITIPKEIRSELGLHPGVRLSFEVDEGRLVAMKQLDEDPLHRWRGRGALPVGEAVEAYLERTRYAHRT